MDNKEFKNKLKISDSWLGQEVNEGDAVVVRRIIGINKMTDIDPYLMLDFFENSKLPGGFPDHPHRGFETVTYLIQGKIFHEDFNGHRGEIEEGDIQWMTAGKGIVHAEMPYSFTLPTSGFQLWINLKKEFKLKEPHYQEIKRDKIPVFNDPNGNFTITIISGKYGDLEGPCKSTTPTSFMDIKMKSNSEFEVPIGEGENSGLVFLFEGKDLKVGDKISIKQYYAVRFDSKSQNNIKFKTGNSNVRFLLIFSNPIKEPITRYGPFVMNTKKEIQEAFEDYQLARNGFENRIDWESEIQYMTHKNKDDL